MFSTKSVALVSMNAIWQPDQMNSSRLKAATLLFDQLIFVGKGMHKVADHILSEGTDKEVVTEKTRNSLKGCWTDNEGRAPEFSIYGAGPGLSKWPWDSGPERLKNATRLVLEKLYGPGVSEENNYEAYKYGGYLTSDILYWREHFADASFIGDEASEDILRLTSFAIADVDNRQAKWSETSFPHIDGVSWNDIADLRQSAFLNTFRKKYAELSLADEAEKVFEHYNEALEQLSDTIRPNIKADVVTGVLGNLPFLPINPVAVGATVHSIYKSHKMKQNFGWVFFLRDLRRAQYKRSTDDVTPQASGQT
jgi:hypothetical protein